MFRIGFDDTWLPDGMEVDVVIPTVPKDRELLAEVLAGVRRYLGHPVNRIYVIAPYDEAAREFCRAHDCEFVDERTVLGYGREAVPYVADGQDRSGWLFQQLLKLAAAEIVQRAHYVVIDSDTVLIRRHVFAADGRYLFLTGAEWHPPYFVAFRQLFGCPAPGRLSYTSHMMIFSREHLRAMKTELERRHGTPWHETYRRCTTPLETSCVSDYDTYANWVLLRHPNAVRNRAFYNVSLPRAQLRPLDALSKHFSNAWKSISFHSYRN